MPGPEFFETRMGRKFFEMDVPDLTEAINRLASAIEKANTLKEKEQNKKGAKND